MKNLPFILMVLSGLVWLECASYEKGHFQQRTNIIVVVNVERPYAKDIIKNVWILLDGISLRKYRIALYSTNGVSQKLIDYQSRQCTVNKLRKRRLRYKRLSVVLKQSMVEVSRQFKKDLNIFVMLTDGSIDSYSRHLLNSLRFKTKNEENFVIQMIEDEEPITFSLVKINERDLIEDLESYNQVLELLPFYQDTIKACEAAKDVIVYDECSRECECVNGRLVNCARIRRQFSALPLQSRITYIDAYKTLATDSRYIRTFYKVIKLHSLINFETLHSKEHFLAFHRKYSIVLENYLRLVDCRVTIPYWNFPLHSAHLYKPYPGYHIWDHIGGFGSTHTTIDKGFCVQTGPFRYPHWKMPTFLTRKIDEIDRYEGICDHMYEHHPKKFAWCKSRLSKTFRPRCMTRLLHMTVKLPTYREAYNILHSSNTTFKEFEFFVRDGCHAAVHDNLGGDFGTALSSLLPEFFPLHSMLDAMWDYWQRKGSSARYAGHWKNDTEFRIKGFKTPRYWYLDNNNLELCGLRIKYTNIFPKDIVGNDTAAEDNSTRNEEEMEDENEDDEDDDCRR